MRKLMWFGVGFGAACFLCAYLWQEWFLWLGLGTVGLAVTFGLGRRWVKNLRIFMVICIGFAVGLGWFYVFDTLQLGGIRRQDGNTLALTMTVADYPYDTQYGQAVDVRIEFDEMDCLARAYLNDAMPLRPGDLIAGSFRLKITFDGGREDPTYHRGDGIWLLAYQEEAISVAPVAQTPIHYYPAVWRRQLLERIDGLFPDETAGFAKALILGERSGIDYETNTAFKVSGISHIIAVSGLHVSILFGLIFLLSGRNRYISGLVGIPVLLLFAAMVGFTPSITRACIMECLMLVAMMLNREYDPPTALAFAGLCILAVNPLTAISVSFQLSFGCMVGIYLFSARLNEWLLSPGRLGVPKGKGMLSRLKRWFAASVSITLGANAVTLPLVAYYFGTVSFIGLVTNLVTLWLVSLIFYGILLVCAVSLVFWKLASLLAIVVSFLIQVVVQLAKALARLPFAAAYTESGYIVLWLVFVYVLLAAYLLLKKKPALTFAACVFLGLFLAVGASWAEPLLDGCRVTALDVGQGQAILLQSEGKTYLVDCGGSDSEDVADKTAEYLMSQGVYRLDGVILTHYDTDHAGALPYLLTRISADTLYLPKAVDVETVMQAAILGVGEQNHISVEEELVLTFGGCTISLFPGNSSVSGNERSICVLFQREKCDILITGDRTGKGELALMQQVDLPELELLIAGHHGAADSTSQWLLEKTTPENVFISVGEGNRYGHPNGELLQRLESVGCRVFRTDRSGTLIYRGE